MSMEIILGSVMIVAMFGTILAKYITSTRIVRLRERLVTSENEQRSARSQLKQAENERSISARNVNQLIRKQQTLEKRIAKYRKEIEELK